MAKRARKPRRPVQLPLPFAREAKEKRRGRPPGAGRRAVRHRVREAHSSSHPVHVVLRSKFKPLRSQFVFPTVRLALAKAARARGDFRVTQFSVQGDHVHLIVEAASKQALSRGMQGLAIRIARRVNALVARSGKLWADRFFARELKSPRVVRNALAYVLNNFRKHRASGASCIDPYSSAPYFEGFRGLRGRAPCELPAGTAFALTPRGVPPPQSAEHVPVVPARTWLGSAGWRRATALPFAARGRAQ
jgi:REP element-mobilizing transposase RayT